MSDRAHLTQRRLEALRDKMHKVGIKGYIVPHTDRYFGENIRPHDERLAFLTGFTGSAGMALITAQKATLLVDGRYQLQAVHQVNNTDFTVGDLIKAEQMSWFVTAIDTVSSDQPIMIGFDPWLISVRTFERFTKDTERVGLSLKACDNLVNAIWDQRPAFVPQPLFRHATHYAGQDVATKLTSSRCGQGSYILVTAPDNLSWLANVRGRDLAYTPSALGVGLITPMGLDIFVPSAQLDDTLFETDEPVHLMDEAQLPVYLQKYTGNNVQLDPQTCPHALEIMFDNAGWSVTHKTDPITLIKAQKNHIERQGIRRAHQLDGLAVTQFLAWFDRQMKSGAELDELGVIAQLAQYRRTNPEFEGPSFNTIAGSGSNGTIVHYRADERSNRTIVPGDILLLDSGGQYAFGTTDITRTLATGSVTPHQKKMYTLVLKGMIAVSMAQFPQGTPGSQIDSYARAPLWQEGVDFAHGTGHGVGMYLNVHEGPIGISKHSHTGFLPHMLVSNEPGYYEKGCFGIRIENLLLSRPASTKGFLCFETVTLAPIDKRLIEKQLLTTKEQDWLNDYHQIVYDALKQDLDTTTRKWLQKACAPL